MRITALVVLTAALLWLGACARFPLFWTGSANPVDPGQADAGSAYAKVELQNIEYDGEALRGRLLVSAVEGMLRVDKRLIENISLPLKSVSDCASGQALYFIKAGVVTPPLREEEILTLEPGYWYGKDIRVPLFDQHLVERQGRPECIEVELMLHVLVGRGAHLRVRATRTPPSGVDSGASAPPD